MKKTKYLTVVIAFFLLATALKAQQTTTDRTISVDINQVKGQLPKSINVCVGAGRANEGLRADWQRQLTVAHNECGFKYIRFHGLLSDDMGVYFEDKNGKPTYNWQYIDELFDFLQRINTGEALFC